MSVDPVGSVVVPAHMEGAVIDRCLSALLGGDVPLEVVVVVNGSTDDTAERARRHVGVGPHRVAVLDLAQGGKAHALNAGDEAATTMPRVYLDADVICPHDVVVELLTALSEEEGLDAAAPLLTYDLTGCPWVVRAYTRVWLALHRTPWIIGSGVYGLSDAGRRRFGRFPDAIADDAFVRSLFAPGERRALDSPFVVHPPRRTWDLVKRKSRVFLGHLELAARGRELSLEHNTSVPGLLGRRGRPPLVEVAAYVAVTVLAKLRARWQMATGRTGTWERDESSRVSPG